MTNSTVLSCTHGSTADVPARDRMAYWDAFNAATLVGLRCSSLSPAGLEVTKTDLALPGLGIADIRGQDHVIERSPALVRQLPKEALFACQIVSGRAYFIQHDRCLLAEAGDIVVYDTRVPYLFGFLTPMRQLLIDIPIAMIDRRLEAELALLPLKISPRPGAGEMLGTTLRASVERFMKTPVEGDAARFSECTRTLVAELIDAEVNGVRASRTSLSYLLTAKQYIATHLGEPELGPQAVADAVGLSLRHLSRLFAAEGESVTQHIWSERLLHAYRELTDARLRKTSVGEIAFRWGFSSQAHFSRAIRDRYGASPMALRDAARTADR
ncbi:AraC family transcriptional regulator [Burkholderia pseudomultivorans]|uniref:helix-turn-helix domain-containing protein n=1 Tax=Burkholderia pseudomultivorans TaxID=1207504 RepID=UPI0001FDB09E|nr:helix-turn-helix domain-containing protein [Burkholderia pseudomultivorans]EGD04477.1 AraC family transcriptional regulator [Burkholderia sp. TJI49]KVC27176.1 AraC family transcriptional regulator [Burkholderia pseudomultivorans]KVC28219.1 AraC family transcriptional regulator [Burkholderia pseudomultivorans]KVC41212.1 AraC family transcriptional regulator [Burkholderia pseudomultivorans]KVG68137.1 AraC family transcriptional regulator [Burkholderia pseudomultivorans]